MNENTQLVDIKAERAAIGAMLINPDYIARVREWLDASDFHDAKNRWIYDGQCALFDQQVEPDYVTLLAWLEKEGHLTEIGGAAYLSGLANATPNAFRAESYARIVQRLGTLRRLVGVAGEIAKMAHSDNADIDDVFTRARILVDSAAPNVSDNDLLLWLDSLSAFVDYQLERKADQIAIDAGEVTARVRYPWKAVDHYTKMLREGTVGIVAAKPGIGKTAFMECCGESWARHGLQVAFFHFELSHKLMLDRRAARWSGMPMEEIEAGLVDQRIDAANAALRLWAGGINYVHCPGWTMGRVATKIRQLHSKGLCDVAIVDYLQKARLVYMHGQNKAQALGAAVEDLKNCAEQLGIFIQTGSQFSNAANGAERKTAAHIRDSGEPEEKANIIVTLDRVILNDDLHNGSGDVIAREGERSPLTTARIDKNTTGRTGDAELYFNGARFAFYDREAR